MATEQVLVYRLLAESDLEERAGAVETALAVAAGPGARPWFEALGGGGFRWEDSAALRRGAEKGELPTSAESAGMAAAKFLRAVNAAAENSRGSRATGKLAPFPLGALRPGAIHMVGGGKDERRKHWFTSWLVWLPATPGGAAQRAPVWGATVEVRIGAGGKALSVTSRARPWRSASPRPAYEHSHDHDNRHGHDSEPPLVYVNDNPGEPLDFWSPCWLIAPEDEEADHHARRLWPACDHTILPEILVAEQDGEAMLYASVLRAGQTSQIVEHGREWQLRWSQANMSQFLTGDRAVSESTAVSLGEGLYQVALQVTHVPTGATRSTHAQIPIGGKDQAPPQEAPPLVS